MVLVCEKWYGCHFDSLDGARSRRAPGQPPRNTAAGGGEAKAFSACVQLVCLDRQIWSRAS